MFIIYEAKTEYHHGRLAEYEDNMLEMDWGSCGVRVTALPTHGRDPQESCHDTGFVDIVVIVQKMCWHRLVGS